MKCIYRLSLSLSRGTTAASATGLPHYGGFVITLRQTMLGGSLRRRDLYLTTLSTDIDAPDGIRARNPSRRAATDPRVRSRGHRVECRELFEMIVAVSVTCHTQYTWHRNICIFFLFNRTTPQVFCYIPYSCSICAPFVILQTSTR